MKEGTFLGADVDERGLDPRKDRFDAPKIDVADHSAVVWTIDKKLYELLILQNRHPRFARAGVDEDFSFHRDPPGMSDGDSASLHGWRMFPECGRAVMRRL
jgi:hypothetical protein